MTTPAVFVIDDDESVSVSICRLLRAMGFVARRFTSADEFLALECQHLPGCLLLDVRMPGMDGLELQQKLREGGSTLPIIFMSAHEDASVREQALGAGALAFLRKPFDDHNIVEVVRSALRQCMDQAEEQERNEDNKGQ